MKDLVIRLRMDRTHAARASSDQIQDHRRIGDSAEEAGKRTRKANTQAYTEAQVQAKATAAVVAKANAERVQAAIKVAAAEKDANKSTTSSILEMAAAAGIAEKGFQGLLKVAGGIRDAFQEADRYARGLRKGFTDERERTAELAGVLGRPADNRFVAENAKFNTATGFTGAEGLDFRLGFQNSGAQFNGKNISAEEYAEFEKQSGQLALARKLDPGTAGDFFGNVLGFKDYSKFGKNASEMATATSNESLQILGRGKGDNATLVRQTAMLNASLLNEDSLKGVITDPNQSAMLISAAAEKSPRDAAEMVKASLRGLRDFNGDAQPLLQSANVDSSTDPIDALRRIAPVVEKEARDSGVKVDDVLKKYFHDHLTAEGIGVLLNKGVSGGIFADREALLAGTIPGQPRIDGPGAALATIDQFQKSERGQLRVAEAGTKETELGIGAQTSRLQTLEEQAKKNLIDRGESGTTGAEIIDFITSLTTFGTLDPKRGRLEDEMAGIIARRAKAVGLDAYSYAPAVTRGALTAESANANLNTALTAVEQAEANALLKRNNELIAAQNQMLQKNAPAKIPTPLRGPGPVPTRSP